MYHKSKQILYVTPLLLFCALLPLHAKGESGTGQSSWGNELNLERLESLAEADGTSPIVSELRIEGLRKTRLSVLDGLILIEEGEPLTRQRLDGTEQRLKKTNLFEKVSFYYRSDTGAEGEIASRYKVTIVLKEKLSLIPIPFFSSSGDTYSFGLGLFEANLLGTRRQLVASAMVSDGEPYATLGFIDPTLAGSNASWTLFFSGGPRENEAAYPDGTIYRRYKAVDARVSAGLRLRSKKRVQPLFGLKYEQSTVDEEWEDSVAAPKSSAIIAPSIGLLYDDSYFIEYFERGLTLESNVSYAFSLENEDEHPSGIGFFLDRGITWSFALLDNHNLSFSGRAAYVEFPVPNLDTLSGSGFRVLPFGSAIGRQYFAGSASYEFPFYRPSWGTCTFLGFFDGGMYEPMDAELESFFGPGGGFRLYLSKVAIPAVGINLGVDLPTQTLQMSVSIGMQM